MKKQITLKNQGFLLITALLIFITALSIAGTVQSKERDLFEVNNPVIKEQEKACMEEIKTVLQNYQCKNSGITMTKTIDIKGSRQYQVTIHHDKISHMNVDEKEELKRDLENIGFYEENFKITYDFLP